jgi:ligand-binding SRPBCC domain-containing protein
MHVYTLEQEQLVPRPLPEVFAFFSDPANLERLTPPFLAFRIVTPAPIAMQAGALIDYELSLHGLPLRWRTLIERFEPERSFVDVQLRGPYRLWRHTHEFRATPAGTQMRDRVEYALPLGPLGRIAHGLWVGRDLARIFAFRREVMAQLFSAQRD